MSDVQENQKVEKQKKARPKKKEAKTHNHGDPIKKIIEVNNRSYKFQKHMNDLLVNILHRYELDKPILMQDKLDIIWDKSKSKRQSKSTEKEEEDSDEEYQKFLCESMKT